MVIFIYRADGGLAIFKDFARVAVTAEGVLEIWGHNGELYSYRVIPQGKECCGKFDDNKFANFVIEAVEDAMAYDKFAKFVEV